MSTQVEVTLAALELELEYAKHVASGGQKADPGRIAAIEEQIKLYSAAAGRKEVELTPVTEDESNKPTDYESHDTKPEAKTEKVKAAKGRAQAELETTDLKEERENADA